ncbi:MAG: hypothetical protein ACTIMJ_04745 [Weissella hellenica]|uniref:hypothetical protein n=1 Tax=Weissella hellenica TaxID=46256 RepID=UPI003F9AA9A0
MHKRQVTMIIGIMVVAAVVAIFAIVFNSSSHQAEEAAVAASSSSHKKDVTKTDKTSTTTRKVVNKKAANSTTSKHQETGTSKTTQTLDIKALLQGQIDAPKIASVKQADEKVTVVFEDDGTKTLDEFMSSYAKATIAVIKAAVKNGNQSVTTARQVKLEDGMEYAVAGKWDQEQLANTAKLSDGATIKDVLRNADQYAIGGAAWDALTQRQKNDYKNQQHGGQSQVADDQFDKWIQAGIVKD